MDTSKQGLLVDRDAIQDIIDRRGMPGTVRLLAQVAASSARYCQAVGQATSHNWAAAQECLYTAAGDISQAMRLRV